MLCSVLVNCLLNAFAIWVGEWIVFSLKVIVLFFCWVGFVLAYPYVVFVRVCCVCDRNLCLRVPSICHVCICMRDAFRV